ncbi:hypothetical protein HA402_003873 [Bradysia odoriphaga]|nr:hypothetical protein HA402_003873 [Bradysia odoriphaga]
MAKSLGKAVTSLKNIKTWQQYFREKSIPQSKTKFYPVDPKINSKLSLWKGDITKLHIDAIVNAANASLLGGGGVDGAIHEAAGKDLLKECKLKGSAKPGEAKYTKGYLLPATWVIHAVGPRDKDPAVLRSAYENSLDIARNMEMRSIAFPCIATGIYGFPRDKASAIAANAVRLFLNHHAGRVLLFVLTSFYQPLLSYYLFPDGPHRFHCVGH